MKITILMLLMILGMESFAQKIIYVHKKNDPRLKAWVDSVERYNKHQKFKAKAVWQLNKAKTIEELDSISNKIGVSDLKPAKKQPKTINIKKEVLCQDNIVRELLHEAYFISGRYKIQAQTYTRKINRPVQPVVYRPLVKKPTYRIVHKDTRRTVDSNLSVIYVRKSPNGKTVRDSSKQYTFTKTIITKPKL